MVPQCRDWLLASRPIGHPTFGFMSAAQPMGIPRIRVGWWADMPYLRDGADERASCSMTCLASQGRRLSTLDSRLSHNAFVKGSHVFAINVRGRSPISCLTAVGNGAYFRVSNPGRRVFMLFRDRVSRDCPLSPTGRVPFNGNELDLYMVSY